jgi:hypothetical protein
VAALELGRQYIGIEIDPGYAAKLWMENSVMGESRRRKLSGNYPTTTQQKMPEQIAFQHFNAYSYDQHFIQPTFTELVKWMEDRKPILMVLHNHGTKSVAIFNPIADERHKSMLKDFLIHQGIVGGKIYFPVAMFDKLTQEVALFA